MINNKKEGVYSDLKLRSVIWIGLVSFICFYGIAGVFITATENFDLSDAGTTGDFIGGLLNPIVALLGIMLLAMTLKQNSVALELTRAELEKSAEQMRISAEALNKQERHMHLQSAETTTLFICSEIEKAYLQTGKPTVVVGRILGAEDTLLELAREIFDKIARNSHDSENRTLIPFECKFDRALRLLVMLARTMPRYEMESRHHLEMVVSCKLEVEFLIVSYVVVHDMIKFKEGAYSLNDLHLVLSLLDSVTDMCGVRANETPVFDVLASSQNTSLQPTQQDDKVATSRHSTIKNTFILLL